MGYVITVDDEVMKVDYDCDDRACADERFDKWVRRGNVFEVELWEYDDDDGTRIKTHRRWIKSPISDHKRSG
jgi:hypothetical protein